MAYPQLTNIVIAKVLEEREPYHGDYQGKPYVIYEKIVSGTLNGQQADKISIKSTDKAKYDAAVDGVSLQAEYKKNGNYESYRIKTVGGPQQAAQQRQPEEGNRQASIVAQTALKAAVEYYVNTPRPEVDEVIYDGVESVLGVAEKFMTWIKAHSS